MKRIVILLAVCLCLTGCTPDKRIDVVNGHTIYSTTEIDIPDDYNFVAFKKTFNADTGSLEVSLLYSTEEQEVVTE